MKKSYKGWYALKNIKKFIPPFDKSMNSFKEGCVLYKSKLELTAIKFCDLSNTVSAWSLEPIGIKYLKPTTGRIHRYFIDFLIIIKGVSYLVEIKSKSDTMKPKDIKKMPEFLINVAKWDAAKKYAEENSMKFLILTENELYNKNASRK